MKVFFWLAILPLLLIAREYHTAMNIHLIQGGTLSTKIINQALNSTGQRIVMERYENDGKDVRMTMVLNGTKPFDPKYFNEIVRDNGLVLTAGTFRDQRWNMEFDASGTYWNIPAITPDEGVQMEKSLTANWFVVYQSSAISIEAPYGNKWYPEIAVLDASMHVLTSIREFSSRERLEFSLPEEAMYLKVSNVNGMKLLKEGMWIEHSDERQ